MSPPATLPEPSSRPVSGLTSPESHYKSKSHRNTALLSKNHSLHIHICVVVIFCSRLVLLRPLNFYQHSVNTSPSHADAQWLVDMSTLAYRCGGSTGIGVELPHLFPV